MQLSSGNYSMRHQVPMVFLLLLVYLSAVAYIFLIQFIQNLSPPTSFEVFEFYLSKYLV